MSRTQNHFPLNAITMLDIVISEIPEVQEPANMNDALHLISVIGIAFLVLFLLIWLVVLFAGYLRRHAGKIRSNLGATPEYAESGEEKK